MSTLIERFSRDVRAMDFNSLRKHYEDAILPELVHADGVATPKPEASERKLLEILRTDGAAPYELMPPNDAQKLFAELARLPVHDGHVATASKHINFKSYDDVTNESYSHYAKDSLLRSALLQHYVVANARLKGIADSYLGTPANLYDIGCFWSYPHRERHPYSQMWHRDWDDYRFLVLFTFLTDILDENDGVHKFIRGSHRYEMPEELASTGATTRACHQLLSAAYSIKFGIRKVRGNTGSLFANLGTEQYFGKRKLHPYYEKLLSRRIQTFMGPCGTSFFEDAGGLHLGEPPVSKPRLLLWVRFGVSRSPLVTA